MATAHKDPLSKATLGSLSNICPDVESQEEVNVAHELLAKHKDRWGVTQITKPALQHGTYSFFFCDIDDNWWEILTNPRRGYAWLFEKGDQEGRGHMDKSFDRPGID